ncbi:hypothetical protein [Streptomyces sp. AM6-12]|uniref:hypothetical protein n=1 Tax=Streptomyces sp. AM6-12 TaxID=3345149 RepID=UPI0037896A69
MTGPPAPPQDAPFPPRHPGHTALPTELACLTPNAGADQLVFAAQLATVDTEAAGSLAGLLARCPVSLNLGQRLDGV